MRIYFLHLPYNGCLGNSGDCHSQVVDAAASFNFSRRHSVHVFTAKESNRIRKDLYGFSGISVTEFDCPKLEPLTNWHCLWYILRLIWIVIQVVFYQEAKPDIVFVDQIALAVPFLRLLMPKKTRVIFTHSKSTLDTFHEPEGSLPYRIEKWAACYANEVNVYPNEQAVRLFERIYPNVWTIPRVTFPSLDLATTLGIKPNVNGEREFIFLCKTPLKRGFNIPLLIDAFAVLTSRHSEKYIHLWIDADIHYRDDVESLIFFDVLMQLCRSYALSRLVTININLLPASGANRCNLLRRSCALLFPKSSSNGSSCKTHPDALVARRSGIPSIGVVPGNDQPTPEQNRKMKIMTDGYLLARGDVESLVFCMETVIDLTEHEETLMRVACCNQDFNDIIPLDQILHGY